MFRKTTMATLVAAVAILGVVAVLQTGGGLMMSLPSMRVLWTNFRMHSIMVEA